MAALLNLTPAAVMSNELNNLSIVQLKSAVASVWMCKLICI